MTRRLAIVFVVLALAACGGDAEEQATAPATQAAEAPAAAAAAFRAPKKGAKVTNPVRVKMTASAVKIQKAGKVREGSGHFHITIDGDCVANGSVIPEDKKHLHFGDGSKTAKLKLKPGKHTLCLQLGNGAHEAFGNSDTIKIRVKKK